jgi:hypothetical protein
LQRGDQFVVKRGSKEKNSACLNSTTPGNVLKMLNLTLKETIGLPENSRKSFFLLLDCLDAVLLAKTFIQIL